MNYSFEGRQHVVFSIPESGEYTHPDFPEVAEKWPYMFVPVSGYIRLRVKADKPEIADEPERVAYAKKSLDRFARNQRDGVVIQPSEIRISGLEPLEFFRRITDYTPL